MSSTGVGNMDFIEGIMNKYTYLEILQRNIKQSVRKLGLRKNFIFQDDNDSKYTAKICRDFIENERITRLEWPY